MAKGKMSSIDSKIKKAQEKVNKAQAKLDDAQAKYDNACAELEELVGQKEEEKKNALYETIQESGMPLDTVLDLIKDYALKDEDGENPEDNEDGADSFQ